MPLTKIASGAGLKAVYVFAIDSSGYPDGDQSGANGYDGVKLSGVRGLVPSVPDAQVIPHVGDDNTYAQDVVAPGELETAVLTTSKTNLTADAVLSNTLVAEYGDAAMGGVATDQQGFEQQVMLVATRQALDTDPDSATFGQRRYITKIYPSARVIVKGSAAEQASADENSYNVVPTSVKAAPWGESFVLGTHGYTAAQSLRLITDNPVAFVRWTGNATLTEFNLPKAPVTVAKTHAYTDGSTEAVASVDTVNDTLTFSGAPANAGKVVAWFETSDNL